MAATDTASFSLGSLREIPVVRQLVLLCGLAGAIAAGISIFTWAQRPAMEPLYANLAGKDAAEVADALRAAGIEYRIDSNSGALTVAADALIPQGATYCRQASDVRCTKAVSPGATRFTAPP